MTFSRSDSARLIALLLGAAILWPCDSRAVFAQCNPPIYQGYVNSCQGLSVRFLNRDSISAINRFEVRWNADGVTQTLGPSAISASRQTGCNFGSSVTITQFNNNGASCAVSSTGNQPHSYPCDLCSGGGGSTSGAVTISNAANYSGTLTPDSIAAAFADAAITTVTSNAGALPLPTDLRGVRVKIAGQFVPLFFVSPRQVNFHIPAWVSPGLQPVEVYGSDGIAPDGRVFTGSVYIAANAPSLFTFSGNGQGDAAGYYIPTGGPLYAILYGQGAGVEIRPDTAPPRNTGTVRLRVAGVEYDAVYAGPARPWIGLQQFNFVLPSSVLPPGVSVPAILRVCNFSGACWNSQGVTLRR